MRRADRLTASASACPVCGEPLGNDTRSRHLRRRHPRYWAAFLVRVISPPVFLAVMFALAGVGAPGWAYLCVLGGFIGLSLWARYAAAAERGTSNRLFLGQWLRGAGIGLLLMSASFGVALLLLSLTR